MLEGADTGNEKLDAAWKREMARKRRKADRSGAAAELAQVHAALTARLGADWWVSASRDELEVHAMIGPLSVRVRRRNVPGRQWVCTAWTKGADEGLLLARGSCVAAVDALGEVLDAMAELWHGLGEVLAAEGATDG
jgi:hypothetical protein